MIPLSAGTPPPPSIEPRRVLTLGELEELHGVDPGVDRVAGLPAGLPWGRLTLVAAVCGLVGFALPLVAVQAGLDVSQVWTAIESALS